MNIGLGIGIPFNRSQIWLSLFDPSKLFTSGVNGAWYDPSDINLTWRRNLLTYTEQFDNAVWAKSNATITANSTTAPDGTTTADTLLTSSTAINTGITRLYSVADGSTISIYAKANSSGFISISAETSVWWANFNLSTGAVGNSNGCTPSITSVGNGWYQCTVANVLSSSNYITFCPITANTTTFGWGASCAAGNSVYIWGAQLEVGSTATPYQRITDGIQDYLNYQAQPVLYRDAAGTLPVTAVEQPVGLMLDKSKGLVLGSELVTNGGFDTDTEWVKGTGWTIDGGVATFTNPNFASPITQNILTANKHYRLTFTVSGASINVRPYFGTYTGSQYYTAAGTYTVNFQAGSEVAFGFQGVSGAAFSIDNISVRELPGNHAFNPSGNSANFPVLSARYNLLTKTEDFGDGVWNATSGNVTVSSGKIIPNATSGNHYVSQGVATSGVTHTITVRAKQAGYTWLKLVAFDRYANFDLANGVVGANYSGVSRTISAVGDGSYICTFTFTSTSAASNQGCIIKVGTADNASWDSANYSGNGVDGIQIYYADLRATNDALNQPAYQRVNTATDYDTVGFKPYLKFNGTNQWLQTNSIDFTYGDKMFVCAGVRKLSDAAGVVLETSANYNSNNGAILFYADTKFHIGEGGTAVDSSTYLSPITNVISCAINRAGTTAQTTYTRLGINGVDDRASYVFADNAGNFGNYPLYIGARAGSSLWFNGRLYGMVVAGKQASAAEIQDTEKYMNLKTAAYN